MLGDFSSNLGGSSINPYQQYYEPAPPNFVEDYQRKMFMEMQLGAQQQRQYPSVFQEMLARQANLNQTVPSGENTLILIKKSIKQIKAEAVSKEAQGLVNSKIERLKKLGVTKQAQILEVELQLRIKLARVQEWDYKVLPYDAIKEYDGKVVNSYTLKVHIDPLDKYCGADEQTEAKDRIIPDVVLTELETAKDRQVFDDFSVLWIEKVKDPLLLGSIKGCKDYFFIAEWGEDIKFDEMVKPEQKGEPR